MDVNGSSNFNGTIMEEITSVPPLTYAQKGGLHQQKVERNKKNTELWTGTHLTHHVQLHGTFEPLCRLNECRNKEQLVHHLWFRFKVEILPPHYSSSGSKVPLSDCPGHHGVWQWSGHGLTWLSSGPHSPAPQSDTSHSPSPICKHTSCQCLLKFLSRCFERCRKSYTHLILKSSAASLALSISSMIRAFSRVFFLTCKVQNMKMKLQISVTLKPPIQLS